MTATDSALLHIEDWGTSAYDEASTRQARLLSAHLSNAGTDTLILTQHPPTVTLGRRGSEADLLCSESRFADKGVTLHRINRGGLATAHEPGQLVVYPVMRLPVKDLRHFTAGFLNTVIEVLAEYGLHGELKAGNPGVWVRGRKICSFGIALKRWVTSHGIALNVNNDLSTFELIIPCGVATEKVTSLLHETGQQAHMGQVKKQIVNHFCRQFGYRPVYVHKTIIQSISEQSEIN